MTAKVVVVLGCRVTPEGRPGPAAARRCAVAARLYESGSVDRVLVSGGRAWSGQREAPVMAAQLERLGVPAERIIEESSSLNTFENARFSSLLLEPMGRTTVTIVTCDFHLPRALRTFQGLGVSAVGMAAKTPGLTGPRRLWLRAREAGSYALQRPLAGLWEL